MSWGIPNHARMFLSTQSAREMAMSEVGAGIMAPWEYRRRFYGETSNEAKANVPEQQGGAFDMLGDGLA